MPSMDRGFNAHEVIDVDAASDLSTLSDAPSESERNVSKPKPNKVKVNDNNGKAEASSSSSRSKTSARRAPAATSASKRKATVDISSKQPPSKKATPSKAAAGSKAKASSLKATNPSKATTSKAGAAAAALKPTAAQRRKSDGGAEVKKVIDVSKSADKKKTVTVWTENFSRPAANEAEPEGDLREDWQVAYVWAFLTRFEYVGIGKTRVDGMWKIHEFEAALTSNGVELAMQEILVALLRDLNAIQAERAARSREEVQRRKIYQSGKVPPKRKTDGLSLPEMPIIEHDLKAFIDTRLIGTRLNVFDPYIFETRYAAGVDTEKGKAALRDPKRSKLFEMMQEQKEDRREHNPLKDIAFAEAGWQIRIKILRQLVDWILEENQDVRHQIADGFADRMRVERKLEEEASTALDQLKYEDLDKLLKEEQEPPQDGPANAFQVLNGKGKAKADEPPAELSLYEEMAVRVIERDSDGKRIFRIDPDYRLYALGNPFHISADWRVIADSKETYEAKMREYWDAGKEVKRLRAEIKNGPAKGRKALQLELAAALRDFKIGKALFDARKEIVEYEQAIEKDKLRQERARQRREQGAWRQHQTFEHVYETRATRRKRVDYTEREDTFDDDFEESPAPSRAGRRSGAQSRESTGSRPTVDDDDDFRRPATRSHHAIVDSGEDNDGDDYDDDGPEQDDDDDDANEDETSVASADGGSDFAADDADENDGDEDDDIDMDD